MLSKTYANGTAYVRRTFTKMPWFRGWKSIYQRSRRLKPAYTIMGVSRAQLLPNPDVTDFWRFFGSSIQDEKSKNIRKSTNCSTNRGHFLHFCVDPFLVFSNENLTCPPSLPKNVRFIRSKFVNFFSHISSTPACIAKKQNIRLETKQNRQI